MDASKWGQVWLDCVQSFVDFEKAAGFSSQDNRLPVSKFRPKELSDWFKSGRKTSGSGWTNFCIGDPSSFGFTWREWWSDIQPTRRLEMGAAQLGSTNIDWSPLQKSGSNGIFLVLVTLVGWRARLEDDTNNASFVSWEESVKDVTRVLGLLKEGCGQDVSMKGSSQVSKSTQRGQKRK